MMLTIFKQKLRFLDNNLNIPVPFQQPWSNVYTHQFANNTTNNLVLVHKW